MILPADGGLDRHVEHLPRDQLAAASRTCAGRSRRPCRGGRSCEKASAGDAVQQDVDLDQVGALVAGRLVVEAGVALGAALQLVEEVDDDLGQRDAVDAARPARATGTPASASRPAAVWHRSISVPVYVRRREDRDLEVRLLDRLDLLRRRQAGRVVDDLDASPSVRCDAVLDARRGGDERQVELALQPLPDDLHVQQAEEAAAEAEAERARRLRRVGDRRVVELQLLEALAQVLEVVAVDRDRGRRTPSAWGRGSPSSASVGRARPSVTVSPTRASPTSLMPAMR